MIILNRARVKEIFESEGVINIIYKNNPVWLESITVDNNNDIQVRNLKTNKLIIADINDLEE